MSRPIRAIVSLAALRHNYWLAKRTAPRSKVLAVLKANAYGHGIERAARALDRADGFATLEIDGAMALRERHPAAPIVLLEGFFAPAELQAIAAANLGAVIHCEEQLRMLEKDRPGRPLDLWLKVNTGMNRLGFPPGEARGALERMRRVGMARSVTLMTHFGNSDLPTGIDEALRRFEEATRGSSLPRSLANTAGIFGHPESHADLVRLGIGLYGATPFADRPAKSLGMKPAMTLASSLIAVQDLAPGESVGYGSQFRAQHPMRIGIVACGYADGYPRHAPTGTPILVDGARTRTVGRVSMDMLAVDLTPVPSARVGSPAVLWGEGIPVDEVAMAAGTVGYELLCAVAPRVAVREAEE
ncbi:MAG TPA: alanine racemase [Usitatibacter sp.]|jgi:alanine racemase|nr:alanine racemase [Usitatibacter sp.]